LTAESGVHVFLVFRKAASAVQGYAEKSIAKWEMCNSDCAGLEAVLHNESSSGIISIESRITYSFFYVSSGCSALSGRIRFEDL
jgi:hypothetical protein